MEGGPQEDNDEALLLNSRIPDLYGKKLGEIDFSDPDIVAAMEQIIEETACREDIEETHHDY